MVQLMTDTSNSGGVLRCDLDPRWCRAAPPLIILFRGTTAAMARNGAAGVKRRHQDVIALSMGGYEIEVPNEDRMDEFYLKFEGPKDTPYEGGQWKVTIGYIGLPLCAVCY